MEPVSAQSYEAVHLRVAKSKPLLIPVQNALLLIHAKIKLSIYKVENDLLPPHPQKAIVGFFFPSLSQCYEFQVDYMVQKD